MNDVNIDYINGFLRALSCGCHGCDYVPFYGATSFLHTEQNIEASLIKHFGVNDSGVDVWSQIRNFTSLKSNECKGKVDSILATWVDTKSKFDREFIETYKDDLLEQIHEVTGVSPQCFYANIEHESFEYENDIIGFVGEDKAFYLHFSFSD